MPKIQQWLLLPATKSRRKELATEGDNRGALLLEGRRGRAPSYEGRLRRTMVGGKKWIGRRWNREQEGFLLRGEQRCWVIETLSGDFHVSIGLACWFDPVQPFNDHDPSPAATQISQAYDDGWNFAQQTNFTNRT